MKPEAGICIEAAEKMDDPVFAGALLFIGECNNDGVVGVIVDRPYGRALNELSEFWQAPAVPLYYGGPVDTESLFFLHRRPDAIPGGMEALEGIYWGGDFGKAVIGLKCGSVTSSDLKIFVGYCGWDAGELEAELAEGYWRLSKTGADTLFG